MTVAELMTKNVLWIAPDAPIGEAARRLAAAPPGVTCLLVGRDGGALPAGIVTEVDVLRAALGSALAPGRLECPSAEGRMISGEDLAREGLFAHMARAAAATRVADVMGSPVRTLPESATPCQAIDLLLRERVEVLPVVRGRVVVGLIHRRALLRALGLTMAEQHA